MKEKTQRIMYSFWYFLLAQMTFNVLRTMADYKNPQTMMGRKDE